MTVDVVLKGALAGRVPQLPGGRGPVALPDDATVTSLLATLELPTVPYIVVIDGAAVRGVPPLTDGARVELHPPMAGG